MDQESFEQTVSQFKKSVKDVGKKQKESSKIEKNKNFKAQTPYREPSVLDEPKIQDILIKDETSKEKPVKEAPKKEGKERQGTKLILLFGIAVVLGLALGIIFAILLVSGELDLPLKDVKQVFKTITAIGSHLR
ncbi:MAG: hypothetical protein HRU09_16560 [Oligoflexales bacterium]|nr:hypothetical protein [Oligoflexales bacterium]